MIRAILADCALAVAALFVLLFLFPSPATRPVCIPGATSTGRVSVRTLQKSAKKSETMRAARARQLERAMPFGTAISPPETARGWLNGLAKPARYIGGRLICAINVNAALAERGIRGTGSALAHSFDRWGIRSGPVVGAVAVTDRRGGVHVAIVSRVENGRVFVWNPSSRARGWREVEYTNRRVRYRVAG